MANLEPFVSIETPSPISCLDVKEVLAEANAYVAVIGCEDGTVRRYSLPETKVTKALRLGPGNAVSWVKFLQSSDKIWLSSGMKLLQYDFSVPAEDTGRNVAGKILQLKDAISKVEVIPESEDDEINEIVLTKNLLAFTSDSGRIGVVDLTSKQLSNMRQLHRNIALPISFIHGRPSEVVSGGHDNTLLHFDTRTGSLLSNLELVPPPDEDEGGIALSPPFILSLAVSVDDVIACSTATGHIWIGYGGSKAVNSGQGKRKVRKWNGLRSADGLWLKAANGPIVAISFHPSSGNQVFTLSLSGQLSRFDVPNFPQEPLNKDAIWSVAPRKLVKATTLVACSGAIFTCGFNSDQKGILEGWKLPLDQAPSLALK